MYRVLSLKTIINQHICSTVNDNHFKETKTLAPYVNEVRLEGWNHEAVLPSAKQKPTGDDGGLQYMEPILNVSMARIPPPVACLPGPLFGFNLLHGFLALRLSEQHFRKTVVSKPLYQELITGSCWLTS